MLGKQARAGAEGVKGGMQLFPAIGIMAVLVAAAPILPSDAASASATPAPGTRTPPPQIIRIVTRPLCAALHKTISPAIGMMLQNDDTIKKSPDLFSAYNRESLYTNDNSVSNSASNGGGSSTLSGNVSGSLSPGQNMALLKMENLVSPLANNIIAIQKLLSSPEFMNGTGNAADDARLAEIRVKLLKAVATQNTSLDLINGFLTTQQMGDLQHAGDEYIAAMNQSDTKGTSSSQPTPMPGMQNPNQIGLPQNPYDIDLADVPGLTLGYNPVTRILDAVHWTIGQTQTRENEAAKSVMQTAAICGSSPSSQPNASPKP